MTPQIQHAEQIRDQLAELLPWRVLSAEQLTSSRPGARAEWRLFVDIPMPPELEFLSGPLGGHPMYVGDSRTFRSPERLNELVRRAGYPPEPPLTSADGRTILRLLHELTEVGAE